MQVQEPVAIDYDPQTERVYWIERATSEIRSYLENEGNPQIVSMNVVCKSNINLQVYLRDI